MAPNSSVHRFSCGFIVLRGPRKDQYEFMRVRRASVVCYWFCWRCCYFVSFCFVVVVLHDPLWDDSGSGDGAHTSENEKGNSDLIIKRLPQRSMLPYNHRCKISSRWSLWLWPRKSNWYLQDCPTNAKDDQSARAQGGIFWEKCKNYFLKRRKTSRTYK